MQLDIMIKLQGIPTALFDKRVAGRLGNTMEQCRTYVDICHRGALHHTIMDETSLIRKHNAVAIGESIDTVENAFQTAIVNHRVASLGMVMEDHSSYSTPLCIVEK
jgi:hypothetical protein